MEQENLPMPDVEAPGIPEKIPAAPEIKAKKAKTAAGKGTKSSRRKALTFLNSEDALSSYLNEIKGIRPLTLAEEKALAERIKQGDKKALNTLVEANLKFVVAFCRHYQYRGLSLGDLINEGNLGLIRAAHRFDANQNFKFISYAVWWIRQAILTALAEQSRIFRLSPGRATMIHKIGQASRRLEQKLARQPTVEHLAEEMKATPGEISDCLQSASPALSLDAPAPGSEDGKLVDSLEDENGAPADASTRRYLLREHLDSLLDTLDERERTVIRLYYGIGREVSYSLEEIAGIFHLTRERIRQIKESAMKRLQHPSRIAQLKGPLKMAGVLGGGGSGSGSGI